MKLQIDTPDVKPLFVYTDSYTIKEQNKMKSFINSKSKKGCLFCGGKHFFATIKGGESNPVLMCLNCYDCGFRHEFNLKTLLDKSKNLLTPEDKKKRS